MDAAKRQIVPAKYKKNGVNEIETSSARAKTQTRKMRRGMRFFRWNLSRAYWRASWTRRKKEEILQPCLSSRCSLYKCLVMGQLYYTYEEKHRAYRDMKLRGVKFVQLIAFFVARTSFAASIATRFPRHFPYNLFINFFSKWRPRCCK